jgi:hypothetical protein
VEIRFGERVGVSGWCAQPGVGQALGDRLVDGSERGTWFGWCVGLAVGGKQGCEDPVVDFGVEDRELGAVGGQGVAVVVGDADDEAVVAEPGEVVAGLAQL